MFLLVNQVRLIDFLFRSFIVDSSVAPTHPQEVILIVNKREETSKIQQTPASTDENNKVSATPMSPRPTRQRERSGVETDDDELLGQIEKIKQESSGSPINDDEILKEKILEARLITRRKKKINLFLSLSI